MAKKQLKGTIISNKMSKTAVVLVERIKEHKKYKKRYGVQKKYKAHIESQDGHNVGDIVLIEECRPLSKEKKWKVIKKLAESKLTEAQELPDSPEGTKGK
jgi:small subunit ribosomal protein S17